MSQRYRRHISLFSVIPSVNTLIYKYIDIHMRMLEKREPYEYYDNPAFLPRRTRLLRQIQLQNLPRCNDPQAAVKVAKNPHSQISRYTENL